MAAQHVYGLWGERVGKAKPGFSKQGPSARQIRPAIVRAIRPLASLALLCIACISPSQGVEPIQTRNHRAFSLAFLRVPARISVLPKGASEWSLGWTQANDLRRSEGKGGTIEEDYEVFRLAGVYRRGLGGGWEIAAEAPFLSRDGGFMDPIIEWWHENVLRWISGLRAATPHNVHLLRMPNGREFDAASGLGDVSLFASKQLCGEWVGTIGLKLPTGDAGDLLGSGSVDFGATITGARRLGGRWHGAAQFGLVAQGKARKLGRTRSWADQELLMLAWAPNSRDVWIVQWQSEAAALRSRIPDSDAPHRLITFGYKRKLSARETLELFFSEDRDLFDGRFPEGANIGPDFTAGIRYEVRAK